MPTTVNASYAVLLSNRPRGFPTGQELEIVEQPVPNPSPGTALVENIYLSVDPYMRQLMDSGWELGEVGEGRSIGRVTESRTGELRPGDLVFHRSGWRTHAVVSAAETRVVVPADGVPLSAYLSVLGGTGLTAYVGLTRIARIRPGETIFVSAAAGGVGTAAGQFARILGASRVVGSTGSAAKASWLLSEVGFDAAFDYRSGPVTELLAAAAPDGIDVYLDNVAGAHLEAAIASSRERSRIACCGSITRYNLTEPLAGPRNLHGIIEKSIRLEGYLVRNYRHLQPELEAFAVPHLQSGRIRPAETVRVGFDAVIPAFLAMLSGENKGKMLVRLIRP